MSAPLDGRWEGVVSALGIEGLVELTIDGPSATLDLPAIGLVAAPLAGAEVTGGAVRGEFGSGSVIDVRLTDDGRLLGELAGAGATAALDLRREHPDAARLQVARIDGARPGVSDKLGPLDGLWDAILSGDYPRVDNVLVARGDDVLVEEYFYGRNAEQLHTFQSCTKSITSLVFGTALDRGIIGALDDPVWRYFPKRSGTRWIDEQYDVTIHDLLRMSVGLEWNEEVHYTDPRNDNTRMNGSGDWVGYVLDRPRQAGWPADKYEYQSGLTILLGAVLAAAADRDVDDLAREFLFEPLGITDFRWLAAPDGTRHTGGGLFLRPRDMLKLGQLVLRKGEWRGQRVLSEDWLARSTSPQTTTGAGETGRGYQWHLPTYRSGDASGGNRVAAILALGYGGQSLNVLPDLDAVVVSNALDYFGDGAFMKILEDHVIPALLA